MKEPKNFYEVNVRLIDNNSKLVDTCNDLVGLVHKHQRNHDRLLSVCMQIYLALTDKDELSLAEEGWHRGLFEALSHYKENKSK